MQFDEMRRRQQAIAAANSRRRRTGVRKFGLLLPQITAPSPHYHRDPPQHPNNGNGNSNNSQRTRRIFVVTAPLLLLISYYSGRTSSRAAARVGKDGAARRPAARDESNWRADASGKRTGASTTTTADDDDEDEPPSAAGGNATSARPFQYIGDVDPTIPRAWPASEVDWWGMHERLVDRVRASDDAASRSGQSSKSKSKSKSKSNQYSYSSYSSLPQLVFYGDSITEGWEGTSLGNPRPNNDGIIDLFDRTFGDGSEWGERALKSSLLLGIGGSRTYDLIWRMENGEFPTSRLMNVAGKEGGGGAREEDGEGEGEGDVAEEDEKDEKDMEEDKASEEKEASEEKVEKKKMDKTHRRLKPQMMKRNRRYGVTDAPRRLRSVASFRPDDLERIYIVLIGTNNLGGGMVPSQTVRGIDAVGRTILRLHAENFPDVPAAILLCELLPRRDDHRAMKMCPPRCRNDTSSEPYTSFTPAIDKVNGALSEVVDGWRRDFRNSRIVLLSSSVDDGGGSNGTKNYGDGEDGNREGVDEDGVGDGSSSNGDHYTHRINCGREMFAFDDESEFAIYMPDKLHPNAKGYELWSSCLNKGLVAIITDRADNS